MGGRELPRLGGERRVSFHARDDGFRRDRYGIGGFLAELSPVPMETRIMVEAVLKDPSHFVGVQRFVTDFTDGLHGGDASELHGFCPLIGVYPFLSI
jgi:hypothetical protein